ncbi:hypothetical protein Tco_0925105 [Tanacetum coccineum]|uniref:DUF4283 domain-containing protein n=1 Tax=Tanacetum coccineum TaxID=301880 RepID=A0ABQ5D5W5_9ASTR
MGNGEVHQILVGSWHTSLVIGIVGVCHEMRALLADIWNNLESTGYRESVASALVIDIQDSSCPFVDNAIESNGPFVSLGVDWFGTFANKVFSWWNLRITKLEHYADGESKLWLVSIRMIPNSKDDSNEGRVFGLKNMNACSLCGSFDHNKSRCPKSSRRWERGGGVRREKMSVGERRERRIDGGRGGESRRDIVQR